MSTIPRQAARTLRAVRHASSSSSVEPLAFPHPALAKNPGSTTNLTIRAFDRIPSSAHALAIVRAVEAHCGTIINVEVPKDPGNFLPGPFIHITLLHPHTLPKDSVLHEIPAPALSHPLIYPGGPSFADLTNPKTEKPTDAKAKPLKFRIEAREKPAWVTRTAFRYPSKNEEHDDRRIVELLKGFEGFHGKLKGLGRDFEPFTVKLKSRDLPLPAAVAGPLKTVQTKAAEIVEPVVDAAKSVLEKVTPSATLSETQKAEQAVEEPQELAEAVKEEPVEPRLSKRERLLAQARESAKANALLAAQRPAPVPASEEPKPQPEVVTAPESSAAAPAPPPEPKEGDKGFFGKLFKGSS